MTASGVAPRLLRVAAADLDLLGVPLRVAAGGDVGDPAVGLLPGDAHGASRAAGDQDRRALSRIGHQWEHGVLELPELAVVVDDVLRLHQQLDDLHRLLEAAEGLVALDPVGLELLDLAGAHGEEEAPLE